MRKILFRIWPPYEFFVMERKLTPERTFDEAWRNALGEATASVAQVPASDLEVCWFGVNVTVRVEHCAQEAVHLDSLGGRTAAFNR